MKTKCILQKKDLKEKFFLLMIAPVLMGLMITFISIANAEWDKKEDTLLFYSPAKQGWLLYGNKANV